MRTLYYLSVYALFLMALVLKAEATEQEIYLQECKSGKCDTRRVNTFTGDQIRVKEYKRDHMGVKRPTGKHILTPSFRLRRADYKAGVCFRDINEEEIYYKVTRVDDDLIWVAVEETSDPFWLKHKFFFFDINNVIKTHQRIDCANAPRLGIKGYTEDCIQNLGRQGVFACDDLNVEYQ